MIFQNHPEDAVEFGMVFIEKNQARLFDLYDLSRLYGFDIQLTGLFSMKTADIGNPVIFDRKLNVVLGTLLI